jgi:hypothetical protein
LKKPLTGRTKSCIILKDNFLFRNPEFPR